MLKKVVVLHLLLIISMILNAMESKPAKKTESPQKFINIFRTCLFYTTQDNADLLCYNAGVVQALDVKHPSHLLFSRIFSWGDVNDECVRNVTLYTRSGDFFWIMDSTLTNHYSNRDRFLAQGYFEIGGNCVGALKCVMISDIKKRLSENALNSDFSVTVAKSTTDKEFWWRIAQKAFEIDDLQLMTLKDYISQLSDKNSDYSFWMACVEEEPVSICLVIKCSTEIEEAEERTTDIVLHFLSTDPAHRGTHLEKNLIQAILLDAIKNGYGAMWFLKSPLVESCFANDEITEWNNSLKVYRKKTIIQNCIIPDIEVSGKNNDKDDEEKPENSKRKSPKGGIFKRAISTLWDFK